MGRGTDATRRGLHEKWDGETARRSAIREIVYLVRRLQPDNLDEARCYARWLLELQREDEDVIRAG